MLCCAVQGLCHKNVVKCCTQQKNFNLGYHTVGTWEKYSPMLCRDEEIERAVQTKNVIVHVVLRYDKYSVVCLDGRRRYAHTYARRQHIHTHAGTQARTHARAHARTHARTQPCTPARNRHARTQPCTRARNRARAHATVHARTQPRRRKHGRLRMLKRLRLKIKISF